MAEQQIKGVKINGTAYSFEDNSIFAFSVAHIAILSRELYFLFVLKSFGSLKFL